MVLLRLLWKQCKCLQRRVSTVCWPGGRGMVGCWEDRQQWLLWESTCWCIDRCPGLESFTLEKNLHSNWFISSLNVVDKMGFEIQVLIHAVAAKLIGGLNLGFEILLHLENDRKELTEQSGCTQPGAIGCAIEQRGQSIFRRCTHWSYEWSARFDTEDKLAYFVSQDTSIVCNNLQTTLYSLRSAVVVVTAKERKRKENVENQGKSKTCSLIEQTQVSNPIPYATIFT